MSPSVDKQLATVIICSKLISGGNPSLFSVVDQQFEEESLHGLGSLHSSSMC